MSTINCNSLLLNEGSSRTDTKERMSSLKTLPWRSTPRTGPRFDITHGGLFDESAAAYDHHRPAYPDVVIQEMIDLSNLRPGSRLLEIGCGTGQATLPLAYRGYAMDCVDPGKNMISVAREKLRLWPHVRFISERFEKAALPSGAYDLVFSAQAFHWIAPEIRLRKTARLLRAGGSIALVYNYPAAPQGEDLEMLSSLIHRESGGRLCRWDYEDEVRGWSREMDGCGLFQQPSICRHSWHQTYTAEEYVGLFRTYSDFLSLPRTLQQRVAACIHRFIIRRGGSICRPYHCLLIHAQKRLTPSGAR